MVEILRISGAFGIRGAVRAVSFSNNLGAYEKITDARGVSFRFEVVRFCGGNRVIIFLEGVKDRNAAESFKNQSFYVKRSELPELKSNEVFICDLIGREVKIIGSPLKCKIVGVENYGAGDLVEVSGGDATFLVPFTAENFPDGGGEILMTAEAFGRFGN